MQHVAQQLLPSSFITSNPVAANVRSPMTRLLRGSRLGFGGFLKRADCRCLSETFNRDKPGCNSVLLIYDCILGFYFIALGSLRGSEVSVMHLCGWAC